MEFVDLDAAVEYGEFGLESGVAPEGYPNLMHVNVRITTRMRRQPPRRHGEVAPSGGVAATPPAQLSSCPSCFTPSSSSTACGLRARSRPWAAPRRGPVRAATRAVAPDAPRPVPVLPSAFYVAAAAAGVEARARAATKLAIAATAAAAVG